MSDKNMYINGAAQVVSITAASVQSTAFGALTTHLMLASPGVGVWYKVGANPTADITTSAYLPPNWVWVIQVNPGEKLACIQPTTPSGTFNVVELIG